MTMNIIMAGERRDDFVECAARKGVTPKGKLYRKQILHMGSFTHPNLPGKKITVDEDFARKLVTNFSNGTCDIVQVPIVDGANKHVEDPLRNVGEVIDLDYDEKGVYAYVDARKAEYADELGKTLIGASAMMNLDYTDTRTGDKVGPTLLHVAITNRPYITNLSGFDEVIAASADTSDETVLLGAADDEETEMPTLEEMLAALKEEHGIDVTALQEQAASADELASLSNVLGDEETDGPLTLHDVAEAVLELSQTNTAQAEQIETLVAERDAARLSNAETEIDTLISEGRILPKQRETMLSLSMTARETFESLLPDEAIVSLSEDGVTTYEDTRGKGAEDETARLIALANGSTDETK